MNTNASLVVVTPVYEDDEACARLFRELGYLFSRDVFVVAVDDGSVARPLGVELIEQAGISGLILKLRRNVGHQRAIAIGLSYVADFIHTEQYAVVMDSDGEDVPATICELVSGLSASTVDVVVAQRKSRIETVRFKAFYAVYKWLFRIMTGHPISFGNFMALKSHAVRRLAAMQELSIHVAASVLASKLRATRCPLARGPRYAGLSKMNFVSLALHGFKGLMVFAEDVLVRVGIACSIIATLSVTGGVAAVILKLIGFSTPGWFSVALGILFLMLLQTGALALMTLMLSGIMRSGNVTNILSYKDFIEEVMEHSSEMESPC